MEAETQEGWRRWSREHVSMCVISLSHQKLHPHPPPLNPHPPVLSSPPPPPFSLNSEFAIMHGRSRRSRGRLKRADDLEQRNEVRASSASLLQEAEHRQDTTGRTAKDRHTDTASGLGSARNTPCFYLILVAFILESTREQYTLTHAARFKSVLQIKDGYKKMRLQFPTAATRG